MQKTSYINKDLFLPKDAWNKLSIKEKAAMMEVAVKNGITDLKTIRQKYNEFAEGGSKEEEEGVNTIVPFTQRREVIITPDSEYNQYLNTLPDNQRFTPNDKYDSYFYWKLNGRPGNFEEAYNKGMFHYDHSDNAYHANSIAFDDNTGVGYFMKPKTHDTVGYELDWFNKGLVTEEGGKQRPVTPEEAVELEEFRKNYFLTNDPDRPNYYRYQPIEKAEGGGIHIKPSHRGRLTELKKRTGKTEAELYNDGNPAHKKMVVFARNSRKWKHGLGGNLFSGEEEGSQKMQGGHAIYLNYPNVSGSLAGAVRWGGIDVGAVFSKATGITSLPFGHAGVILVDEDGNSDYYDYGRYKEGTDKYGVSTFGKIKPKKGNWRTKKLPRQKQGENDSVYIARIQNGLPDTQFGEYQALSFPNIDIKKARNHINKEANNSNRKSYGVGNTCVDAAYKSIVPFLQDSKITEKIVATSPEEFNTEGYSPFAQFWSLLPGSVGYTSAAMRKVADKTYIMNKKK